MNENGMYPRERIETAALIAEIVGAIAVVISVIYLAVQITDNTRALISQGHYNALSLAQRPLELLIADRELSAIVELGTRSPQDMSGPDWLRFSSYQLMALNAWEFLYYANLSESIPVSLWEGADAYYRQVATSGPGLRRVWSEYEHGFGEPFNSYADKAFDSAHPVPNPRAVAFQDTVQFLKTD